MTASIAPIAAFVVAVQPLQMQVPHDDGPGKFFTVSMLPSFTSLYTDWIMRAHATIWKAPGGTDCGGWCQCLK